MTLQKQAGEALRNGAVTKIPCQSKQEVLNKIVQDEADAMSVSEPGIMFEAPQLQHYAVKFNDRELGAAVRLITMRGFGLEG